MIGTDRADVATDPPADEMIHVDLSEPGAVAFLVGHVGNDRLDGLVNNAAFQPNLSVAETPDEVWDEVMATNFRAPFQLIRDLAPRLAEVHGGIVNVSSVHAIVTSANVAAYAVSKGALVALTRSAAIDLAPLGVRCNAVLPGAVQTPMLFDGLSRRPHAAVHKATSKTSKRVHRWVSSPGQMRWHPPSFTWSIARGLRTPPGRPSSWTAVRASGSRPNERRTAVQHGFDRRRRRSPTLHDSILGA